MYVCVSPEGWGRGVMGGGLIRPRGVLGSCLLSFDTDSRIYGLILSLASSACPSHLHAGQPECVCVRLVCVCACGSYWLVLSLCPTSVSHPRSLSNPGLWLPVVMALHFCNWLKCDFSKIGRSTHHLVPQLVVMSSPPFVLQILACASLSGCVCLLLCLYPLLLQLVESLTAMLLFFFNPVNTLQVQASLSSQLPSLFIPIICFCLVFLHLSVWQVLWSSALNRAYLSDFQIDTQHLMQSGKSGEINDVSNFFHVDCFLLWGRSNEAKPEQKY